MLLPYRKQLPLEIIIGFNIFEKGHIIFLYDPYDRKNVAFFNLWPNRAVIFFLLEHYGLAEPCSASLLS